MKDRIGDAYIRQLVGYTSAVETHRLGGRYFGTFQLSQKVQSLGCLFNNIINMTIPLKVAADSQTQNFTLEGIAPITDNCG